MPMPTASTAAAAVPIAQVGSQGRARRGLRDGAGPQARFDDPWGIVAMEDGTRYVADAGDSNRIRTIAPDGARVSEWVAPDVVVPGDRLVLGTRFANRGDAPAPVASPRTGSAPRPGPIRPPDDPGVKDPAVGSPEPKTRLKLF